MDCNYFKELLSAYIDNYIKQNEKLELEEHLLKCNNCKEYLNKLKNYKDNLKNFEELEAPIGFEKKVMRKIEEKEKAFVWFFGKRFILEFSAILIVLASLFVVYINIAKEKEKSIPSFTSKEKIEKSEDKLSIEKESKKEQKAELYKALPIPDFAPNEPAPKAEQKIEIGVKESKREQKTEKKVVEFEKKKQKEEALQSLKPPITDVSADEPVPEKEEEITKEEQTLELLALPPKKMEEKKESLLPMQLKPLIIIKIERENYEDIINKIEEILKNEKIVFKKIKVNEHREEIFMPSKDFKNIMEKISNIEGAKIENYNPDEIINNKEIKIELLKD